MKGEIAQLGKYGVVGVINTLLTLVIFIGLRALGVGLDISNLLSFAAGIACSFLLNKLWTFRAKDRRWMHEGLWFATGAAVCWLVQWGAFRLMVMLVPEIVAQIGGMVVYTLLNFNFNKWITFRH